MKRALPVVAVVAALTLAACGGGASEEEAAAPETPAGEATPSEPVELIMNWWGEQEAPGAQQWLDQAIAAYEEQNPNVTITATLVETDALIPTFEAAAAAKTPLDIQYFWGGIYTQQPGWAGHIAPISDYIDAEELSNYTNALSELSYEGKVWTAPWYVNPSFPVLVNKELLAANGLTTPKTWDEFMAVCDALSAQGISTIAGGVKDGWFGGWLYSMIGAQSLTSHTEVLEAVVGNTSFTDPAMADWWGKLAESRERGCWNEDINSLELYQAQELFLQGQAAMTVVAGPEAPNFAEQAGGPDKVEVISMPAWTDGPFAGKIASTSQTLGIPSWSENKEIAADFIRFTHTPEQLQAWYDLTGSLPADNRFDISQVTDPIRLALFEAGRSGVPYIENFIPAQLDADAIFKNVQLVLDGSVTPEEAAADTQAIAERLRTTDRDLVPNFTAWASTQ